MATAPEQDIINGNTPLEEKLWGVHPRLYLTKGRLEEIKKNLHKEPWKHFLKQLHEEAEKKSLAHIALAFLLHRNPAHLETARAIMVDQVEGKSQGFLADLALAYDWLYHDLDEALRNRLRDFLNSKGRPHYEALAKHEIYPAGTYAWNIFAHGYVECATAGMAIYGDCPNVAPWMRFLLEKTRVVSDALGPDGVSPEGINYGGVFDEFYIRVVDLVRDLLGLDLYRDNDYLKNMPTFILHSLIPVEHMTARSTHFCFGDGVHWNWLGPSYYLRRLASVYRNSTAQWTADVQESVGASSTHGSFLNMLWYDPTIPATPPDHLPLFHHFTNNDLVFMRNRWDGKAMIIAFRCGPHAGHHALQNYTQCIGGGHMTPDAGSFQVFGFGDWLISDGGYAHKYTAYRNTVLVNGIGQTGEGNLWFECSQLRREKRGPRILRAESHKTYDVVTGDATAAYEPQAVLKRFYRHILFVHAAHAIVIIDELITEAPAIFDLHFHAVGQEFQTDRPFEPSGPASWISGGSKGKIQISAVAPSDAVGFNEIQNIKGEGAHRDRGMCLLRLRNNTPTHEALFVTLLEVFPAGKKPSVSLTLTKRGDRRIIQLKKGRAVHTFGFIPFLTEPAAGFIKPLKPKAGHDPFEGLCQC